MLEIDEVAMSSSYRLSGDILFFRILVYIAQRVHLFPFRTQKLSSVASMVLRGFTWKSRYMPRSWKKENSIKNFMIDRVLYVHQQSNSRIILENFFVYFNLTSFPFWISFPGFNSSPGSSVEEQKPSKLKVTGSIPVSGTIWIISSVG